MGVRCFPLDLNSHDSEQENLHRRSAGVPERSRYSILESDVGGLENGCRPGPLGNDDGSNQTRFHTAAGGVEPLGAILGTDVSLLQVDLAGIGKGEEKDQYGRNSTTGDWRPAIWFRNRIRAFPTLCKASGRQLSKALRLRLWETRLKIRTRFVHIRSKVCGRNREATHQVGSTDGKEGTESKNNYCEGKRDGNGKDETHDSIFASQFRDKRPIAKNGISKFTHIEIRQRCGVVNVDGDFDATFTYE